jgi:hypothetical protein
VIGSGYGVSRAEGVYLSVELTVTNSGDEQRRFERNAVIVVDDGGRRFEVSTEAVNALSADVRPPFPFVRDLDPGDSFTRWLVYDVPRRDVTYRLRVPALDDGPPHFVVLGSARTPTTTT